MFGDDLLHSWARLLFRYLSRARCDPSHVGDYKQMASDFQRVTGSMNGDRIAILLWFRFWFP
jgi:hypothetical protein